jgi:hypothetical protein
MEGASEDNLGDGAEQLPPFWDALQDVGTEILKLDARAGNQILHCPRHKHVIRATDMRYAGGDVHSNPANVVFRQLNLAGVDANAHGNLKPMQGVANGIGAVNRPRRTIEGRQETVTEGFHLFASEA